MKPSLISRYGSKVVLISATALLATAASMPPSLSLDSGHSGARTASDGKIPGVYYKDDGSVYCVGVQEDQSKMPMTADGFGYGQSCFNNPDSRVSDPNFKRLADVDTSKSAQDLRAEEDKSPLDPKYQKVKGTRYSKPLTKNEQLDPMGEETARQMTEINRNGTKWLTGSNVGWGTGSWFNIPTFAVDSSNSNQYEFDVESHDGRVINNPDNKKVMLGGVPFPEWAVDRFESVLSKNGDRAIDIVDNATGINRSMFYAVPKTKGHYHDEHTVARFIQGTANAENAVAPRAKLNYDVTTNATNASTSAAPTSDNLKEPNESDEEYQKGTRERRDVPRNATFFADNSVKPGVRDDGKTVVLSPSQYSVDEKTGKVTLKVNPSDYKSDQVLEAPVKSKYPMIVNFSSGGYTIGGKGATGLGPENLNMLLNSGTSSVVGAQNADTQIGVQELLNGKINHTVSMTADNYQAIASAPMKMADGNVNSKNNKPGDIYGTTDANGVQTYPNALHAGQRFTYPEDFDVDKWILQNRPGDKVLAMIMHAIQDWGGVVTDRNIATNAFNFESPESYAPYARQGKNVYQEIPQLKEMMRHFYPYELPYDNMQFIKKDYLGDVNDPSVKEIKPVDVKYKMDRDHGEVYYPESVDNAVYQGQESLFSHPGNYSSLSPNLKYHANWNFGKPTGDVDIAEEIYFDIGTAYRTKVDKVGTYSQSVRMNWLSGTDYYNPEKQPAYYDNYNEDHGAPKHVTFHSEAKGDWENSDSAKMKDEFNNMPLNTAVVDRSKGISRTDRVNVKNGSASTFNILSNDESSFGAKSATSAAVGPRSEMAGIHLYDKQGNRVKELKTNKGIYTVVSVNGHDELKVGASSFKDAPQGYDTINYKGVSAEGAESQNMGKVSVLHVAGDQSPEPTPDPTTPVPTPEPTTPEPTKDPTPEPNPIQIVHGIKTYYESHGGHGVFGDALANEEHRADGVAVQRFSKGSYEIYWTPFSGAHAVKTNSALGGFWSQHDGANRYGYPSTDEIKTSDGSYYQEFRNKDGFVTRLVWTPGMSVNVVHPQTGIGQKWLASGGTAGLGTPVMSETHLGNGLVWQKFEGKGKINSIFWTVRHGAHTLNERGAIAQAWTAQGREHGAMGHPITDEFSMSGGRAQQFSNGSNLYTSMFKGGRTGTVTEFTAISDYWSKRGRAYGYLGSPVGSEVKDGDKVYLDFQNGIHKYRVIWKKNAPIKEVRL